MDIAILTIREKEDTEALLELYTPDVLVAALKVLAERGRVTEADGLAIANVASEARKKFAARC